MRRAYLFGAAIPVLALALASVENLPTKVIYNASASAPKGFYWIDQGAISRGDFVYAKVPKRVRDLITQRGYLPPNVPLLKRVVGLKGDQICRAGDQISMNGIMVARAQRYDGKGRKMPGWHGCHIITDRTVFLLQDHSRSFDGRYFGPVDRRLIIGRATRLRFLGGNASKANPAIRRN